jgi:hypothetical protein
MVSRRKRDISYTFVQSTRCAIMGEGTSLLIAFNIKSIQSQICSIRPVSSPPNLSRWFPTDPQRQPSALSSKTNPRIYIPSCHGVLICALCNRIDRRDNKLHLNEVPIPTPKPNELLIKIACSSLCHSDLMNFEPNDQGLILGQNPVTLGHEASGYVAQVGSDVTGFEEGDQVGFLPAYEACYECDQCVKTHNNW